MTTPLVLKIGGELLETEAQRASVAATVAALASEQPLVLVHGGGRAIDAALAQYAIAPRKIDGLRVTDEPTRDVVVSVLAGSANTALVASLVGLGVPAVGLTGVDAGFAPAARASEYRASTGAVVDLGFVGDPVDADPALLELLTARGYVPVVASLGVEDGVVLNVNADVMAGRIAAALRSPELVIAGGTAGVLDADGQPIANLDAEGIDRMIASGTATAGMIAKLEACRAALLQGVPRVRIVDGRALFEGRSVPGTTVVLSEAVPALVSSACGPREDSESSSAGARASGGGVPASIDRRDGR
ncbi:MAG TPA: acetylglutamate kinase [Vicinamibacterales bacterium]|nr:acetylglutamate kinase [Vicinamibacterales bacterium]